MKTAAAAIADNPWLAQRARIARVTPEVPGVATYHLRLVDAQRHAQYAFQPGQFNMLYLPGVGEVAISLSAGAEQQGTWDHTIRAAGSVTRALAQLPVGAELGLRGPYGAGWPLTECAGRDVIVVAGGLGLAPLRPAIHALLAEPKRWGRIHLLLGARTADSLLYPGERSAWERSGLAAQTTVDRATPDWTGNVGVVPLLVDRLAGFDPARAIMFICGPEVMMRYTIRSALKRGIAAERIWLSLERNMQCAVGLCGHCQFGPAFICQDGPVLRSDRIAPFLDVEGL
ncbi:MAG: FAD/NAD(P)-binding protein [Planctomycetaceae bacterium]|nr:FAD/NAD(P)-binding protein [Planctomycetaceae bacterium]